MLCNWISGAPVPTTAPSAPLASCAHSEFLQAAAEQPASNLECGDACFQLCLAPAVLCGQPGEQLLSGLKTPTFTSILPKAEDKSHNVCSFLGNPGDYKPIRAGWYLFLRREAPGSTACPALVCQCVLAGQQAAAPTAWSHQRLRLAEELNEEDEKL